MDNSENGNRWSTNSFGDSKNYPRSYIVISFVLFLYIFVIALTLQNKKLRRRSANKFLMNLFISDGIVCISFISYAGQLLAIWDNERYSFDHYLMLQTPVIFIYVAVIFSMLNFPLITADRLIYSYCLGDYYSICDTHDYNRQCLGSWNQEMFRERHLCCCSYNRFHYALYIEFLRICGSEGQTKSVWENHSWHREHSSAQW